MTVKISSSLKIQSSITGFDNVVELNVLGLWKIWTSKKKSAYAWRSLIGMEYP